MKKPVIFISGASSGFGLEMIRLFAQSHTVYAGVRNLKKTQLLPGIRYLECDVTVPETISDAFATIQKNEGELHYLVNNAGCAVGGFFEDVGDEQFRMQMEVNFFGVLAVTRAALPLMRQTKGDKKIIMISSVAGFTGLPSIGAYSASKWAVEGFSESLFFELKPFGIDVVLIEPGTFKTDIFTRNLTVGKHVGNLNSPYFEHNKRIKSLLDKRIATLKRDPKRIALLVEKVLKKKKPKLRYRIGSDANVRFFIRQWMPFSWYSRLVCLIVKT